MRYDSIDFESLSSGLVLELERATHQVVAPSLGVQVEARDRDHVLCHVRQASVRSGLHYDPSFHEYLHMLHPNTRPVDEQGSLSTRLDTVPCRIILISVCSGSSLASAPLREASLGLRGLFPNPRRIWTNSRIERKAGCVDPRQCKPAIFHEPQYPSYHLIC